MIIIFNLRLINTNYTYFYFMINNNIQMLSILIRNNNLYVKKYKEINQFQTIEKKKMSKKNQLSSSNIIDEDSLVDARNISNAIQFPNQSHISKTVSEYEGFTFQKGSKIKIVTENSESQSKEKLSKSRRKYNQKVENKQKQSLSHLNLDRSSSSSRSNSESMRNTIRRIELILSELRDQFNLFQQNFNSFIIKQGQFNEVLQQNLNQTNQSIVNLQKQVNEKLEVNYTMQKDVAQFTLKGIDISQNQRLVKNLITVEQKDQSHNLRSSSMKKKIIKY
ncbi:hypothetical protein TTHERM_001302821 (macronuclear) [Tetrahymena thermophila SB210]|uniref:Uncharacterized protein n=1 Tax=Tetrahymena thermophila (strain SB210) TaxID=312017 RepID=W7XDH0_TETTS|nr:hypothetical protein TTHERM_001302821 [Tetrahymena thermophila SB210]EWS75607.1 hypothetical protein TTHERM_001302821 [Tetrahymena thermophila SB210]|eukprot:XP_012651860.1 hypothetical protein TTHERM_001302821 [Tetrahymena thermophila SB210]